MMRLKKKQFWAFGSFIFCPPFAPHPTQKNGEVGRAFPPNCFLCRFWFFFSFFKGVVSSNFSWAFAIFFSQFAIFLLFFWWVWFPCPSPPSPSKKNDYDYQFCTLFQPPNGKQQFCPILHGTRPDITLVLSVHISDISCG